MVENNQINSGDGSSTQEVQATKQKSNQLEVPSISLPKGGGAIKSIDEKFQVNAANGTAGFSIPFPFSPSRNGFMPGLTLSYNSGAGNGIFGLGWNAEPASITRKTDKKLPEYNDEEESDTFIFSGAEDLVPAFRSESGNWISENPNDSIKRYRPRVEGGFARIEKITETSGNVYWKVTSKENVVSVFGKSKSAQIFDPNNELKIYKWLLEFSYDDKGNCFHLEYKKEDKTNVVNALHEKNRLNDFFRCTNAYLKRAKYGNKKHLKRPDINFSDWENSLAGIEYLLQLVLDYGEHDNLNPQPDDDKGWLCRQDAFSDYRAGFEIRTWRLCQRVLMFHHFEELGDQPCLVRSLNMNYDSGIMFTFLQSIIQKGFIRKTDGSYSEKSLPPVDFTYEKLGWDTSLKTLPKESLENLPVGIDDRSYQWIDLYSEGLSGVLTEQSNGWYYKRNNGDGNFESLKLVSPKPSLNGLSTGAVHFQDIEANGQKFLVSNDLNGYYEYTPDNEWLPFRNFKEIPNVDLRDPNLKFIDLNGDGMADILISEDNVFVWYPSEGKKGFGHYNTKRKNRDEEKGPNIVFADLTQSIVLADMSGDGLADIVRIRYNDIAYWPNCGNGVFGAKVNMSNAPLFDSRENFNPNYLKLADLDGSGITDIVYLGKDSFKIYFNQGGNSWSEENIIKGINPIPFSKIDDHTAINIIDLLGNGTGCIVWSSPLPKNATNPLRYIDLMNGRKPHIMTSYKNNMGKEMFMEYKPSTFYYLKDKAACNPWITKLPFPVQCVSEVVVIDQIRKTRFTNSYSYHHGYYDYKEREFRGFGRVEQTDTEDYENYKKNANPDGSIQVVDERLFIPPVLSKTWFHTGAFLDKEKILDQFSHEYYQNEIVPEKKLEEPVLPADWSTDEWREALRACKGMPLHSEVYSLDGTDKQAYPYTTAQHTCLIKRLQPTLDNKNAVFIVLESEALTYTYERNPADPRIAHSMNIEADEYGNVLKAAAISYGRKIADPDLTVNEQAEQGKTHVIFSENNYTTIIKDDTDYHLALLWEARTHELTGLSPASEYFTLIEISEGFQNAEPITYYELPTVVNKEKRIIEWVRTVFLKNDLSGPLPLGIIQSLALPYQSYKLALTTDIVQNVYGEKVNDAMLLEGKYFNSDDGGYWIGSGTQTFDPEHFYQVIAITDPFNYKSTIVYDVPYRFYIQQTIDELNNTSDVTGFNFRTLSPYVMKDINDNCSGVRVDELGMVMSSFVMGKENENKGDFLDASFSEAVATDQPTSTLEYDLFNYMNNGKPNYTKTQIRETHYFDRLDPAVIVIWQTSYSYSCGGGNEVMRKVQAEPGIAKQLIQNEDGTYKVEEVDTSKLEPPQLRWIGNGRTILNNKVKPVKQYEPYFSTNPGYEDAKELVEKGVTPIIYYDSAGRVVRTDLPDGTFSKVEFDSWMQLSFDPNDTVLESKWYSDRINNLLDDEFTTDGKDPVKEKEAAQKAAAHANTPTVAYLDSLGRNFLSIADNAERGKYKTLTETDIEGNVRRIIDARGNTVMSYKYGMLGNQLYSLSMDAGERWGLADVMGKHMRSWDSRGNRFQFKFDQLHRPTTSYVATPEASEIVFTKIIYGEDADSDTTKNLRGKAVRQFDAAGVVTNSLYDFKGNLLQSARQLCKEYKNNIDWDVESNIVLQEDVFVATTAFDALNRAITITAPDASIITPSYNEANLLETVSVQLKGATDKTLFVKDINYNEKGQRESIIYGNDTKTSYSYDSETFRLIQLNTLRKNENDFIQKLSYTYDPVGNITYIKDEAQQTIFFNNAIVEPSCDYVYDAIYQLVKATGREHIGQNQLPQDNWKDENFTNIIHKGDGNAMRNYIQSFLYDEVGNIKQLQHAANGGSYTRDYNYETVNNRLVNTKIGDTIFSYHQDIHGNINQMPHLASMEWDFKDQLYSTQQTVDNNDTGEKTYYVYDGSGQRVRKITEQQNSGAKKEERIYLGGFEIFRSYKADGTSIQLERETLHVMDDKQKVAFVEIKTVDDGANDPTVLGTPLIRYQFSNHLGSASLELDENAAIVSYEEYHPYGTTSYQATGKNINPVAKRYRYTGMERDEESGFEYHTARYYLPWLGRWLSADPIGVKGGINVFNYASQNPINFSDKNGMDKEPGNSNNKLLEDRMVKVVYKRHSENLSREFALNGSDSASLEDKIDMQIYNYFTKIGELSSGGDCQKDDNFKSFDLGVEKFAQAHHLQGIFQDAISKGDLAFKQRSDQQLILWEDGSIGSRLDREKVLQRIQDARSNQTLNNIEGGIFGAIGYGIAGDIGSDSGSAFDGIVTAFGVTFGPAYHPSSSSNYPTITETSGYVEKDFTAAEKVSDYLETMKIASSTVKVASLTIVDGKELFGLNQEWENAFVNLSSMWGHAEIDSLGKAFKSMDTSGRYATMYVTKDLCKEACLTQNFKGNVRSAFDQMGLQQLTIITPTEFIVLNKGGSNFRFSRPRVLN